MLSIEQIQSFYPESIRKFPINLLREYLQYKILEAVFRSSFASRLSLMGGTCIHLIHGSPRFSEDLDFDNDELTPAEFQNLASTIESELRLEGYKAELKITIKGAYHAHYRFPSILIPHRKNKG